MKKLILIITLIVFAQADSYWSWDSKSGVAPSSNKMHINECGSCHFAYQAGLLPERSWVKIMGDLENHFDTDASLDTEDIKKILDYLVSNSAEKSTQYKRSRKINNSISKNSTPVFISRTPYLQKKHREIPKRYITQKEVSSISNCKACHTKADKGSFSEREIFIPNYGSWDD